MLSNFTYKYLWLWIVHSYNIGRNLARRQVEALLEKESCMQVQSYHARILVKNKPISEYKHNDKTFVEGRHGSEFELELQNKSGIRVLMIPSVDGLSIVDGKPASEESGGFVLNPQQTMKIPGWMLDNKTAAKFFFAGKNKSYAATHPENASPVNVGVIGVQVWNERPKLVNEFTKYGSMDWTKWVAPFENDPFRFTPIFGGGLVGTSTPTGLLRNANIGTVSTSYAASSVSNPNSGAVGCVNNIQVGNITPSTLNEVTSDTFNIGAGFGKATDFKTTDVDFEKSALQATLVIYYDDKKGLQSRGIEIAKPKVKEEPNPFPNSKIGCTPPKNWK